VGNPRKSLIDFKKEITQELFQLKKKTVHIAANSMLRHVPKPLGQYISYEVGEEGYRSSGEFALSVNFYVSNTPGNLFNNDAHNSLADNIKGLYQALYEEYKQISASHRYSIEELGQSRGDYIQEIMNSVYQLEAELISKSASMKLIISKHFERQYQQTIQKLKDKPFDSVFITQDRNLYYTDDIEISGWKRIEAYKPFRHTIFKMLDHIRSTATISN